jgi:hypothetical protein
LTDTIVLIQLATTLITWQHENFRKVLNSTEVGMESGFYWNVILWIGLVAFVLVMGLIILRKGDSFQRLRKNGAYLFYSLFQSG